MNRTFSTQKRETELSKALKDLKDSQVQLKQLEKMAKLGQLAVGVAHDLNNHLNYISGGFEALKVNITDWMNHQSADSKYERQMISELKSDIIEAINSISKGVEESSKIIGSLKTFSSPQENQFITVSPGGCVDAALEILSFKVKHCGIEVIKDYQQDWSILGNPASLCRVFLNIIDNAIDSMEKTTAKHLLLRIFSSEERTVSVEIRDTGCGFHQDSFSKIFHPFFTTKEIGDGTGLGLSIASEIIAEHNGKITFLTELNQGTTFTIKFNALPFYTAS
jgi:two-component system NtrC family sensor kinase